MSTFMGKRGIGIIIAVLAFAAACLIPPAETLSREGLLSLGVLVAGVAMWVCDSFPVGVTGIIILAVGAILGAAPASTVFSGFGASTTIFVMTVFALTTAFNKSQLSNRLVGVVVHWSKGNTRKLVLGVMCVTALVSMVMSDSAVIALFFGLSISLLKALDLYKKKSNFAKCLFIGVPFAGVTGGLATPAGNATNIAAVGMLEAATGQQISFLGWMIIGVPIAAAMILVLWLSVTFVFKPESLGRDKIERLYESVKSYGPFLVEEKKTLCIILGVPILWILGTWFPLFNMTVISVLAMGLMLAPGFNLLMFDEYQKGTPWNVVIMVGAMISMGTLLGSTGGSQFIGDIVLSMGFADMSIVLALFVLGLVLYFLHTVMPIGPGFVPVFFLPLVTICTAAGLNPISAAVMMSAIIGGNYLFPINPTIAITYNEDTYEIKDMFKAGIVPVFVLCLVMALWIPFITDALTNVGMLYAV